MAFRRNERVSAGAALVALSVALVAAILIVPGETVTAGGSALVTTPYARLLLAVVPDVRQRRAHLPAIPGSIPAPAAVPAGCRFHPRCPDAIPLCGEAAPALDPHGPARRVRCWRAAEEAKPGARP